jgi:transcriptional regulator with XRE-family HTH domain
MSNTNNKLMIGKKLRVLREKNVLSQEAVANFLGVSQDHLNAIEIDEGRISTEVMERLCELYGCSSRDLLNQDTPQSIEYTQPLSEYEDILPAMATVNRIALNLLEMQRLQIAGDQFKNNMN